MELYGRMSYELAAVLTSRYSTSFSSASKLFDPTIRQHIYAIYGLVRIADEIVDGYDGSDKAVQLDELEGSVYAAIKRGFSTNPIVHSFALTAAKFGIDKTQLGPFFDSMRMDIEPRAYNQQTYEVYIYGSAEVIGLMCLKVFCDRDQEMYDRLSEGARRLGAAYQKVNFLRDIKADHEQLGRWYFPDSSFDDFNADDKQRIVADIQQDFAAAEPYVKALPRSARRAVSVSFEYYCALLRRLELATPERLKRTRIRLPAAHKSYILFSHAIRRSR